MTGHPRPEEVYKATPANGFIKKPLERAYFLDFMQRTIHVIAVGKRVASKVTRTNEYLSSVARRHADVDRLLPAVGPLDNHCSVLKENDADPYGVTSATTGPAHQ
jgi:hypothetical protein